jgi:hypothetical protein
MRNIALGLLAATIVAMPATAQVAGPGVPPPPKPATPSQASRNAPVNGVLVLYGNEQCPTDRDGNEIVVCTRRDAAEQFRVPKELRNFKVTPENQSWALRAQGTLDTGASGIGSCSAIGPGGSLGCSQQQFRDNKLINKDRKAAEEEGK